MGYGAAQMTNTTGAVFIPDVWANEVEIARESMKVMENLVKRKDADVAKGGNLLEIPFVSNLSTTAVSDNTAVTFQAPTETKIQVSLNRYFESSVAIQKRLSIQAAYDLASQYQQKIAEALTRNIQTDLTGLYSGLSQTVGTGLAALTEPNVSRAVQYLNDANAPMQNRHFVVRPAAMNQLNQIARFTEYQTTGKNSTVMTGANNGLVGNTYGVDVHMTTDIAQVSGTPGTVHNLLFHKDFAVLAIQSKISVARDPRPDYLATGYIADCLWGYAELRDDHGVDVRTVINT